MLSAIIRFALSQRLFTLLLVLFIGGYGIYAFQNLPIDAFPDVSTPQVKIVIKVPGMTPEEVETRVLAPVELEMLGIPGETMLRSMAKYGLVDITMDFEDGTDIYWARQQVNERLSNIWASLPPGATGGMAPITTPLGEMFMFTIEGGSLSLKERRSLLDWVIRPQLRTVPGVADVNALGGLVRTFEVIPDAQSLAARGLTMDDVARALSANNRDDGAGRLQDGEEALLVRSLGQIQTLDDVRAITIATKEGTPIRIADVATVRIGALTRYGGVTRNGQDETVEGLVLGLRGANARLLVEGVREKIGEIQQTLPQGVKIEVFYDRGKLVEKAVGTVERSLLEAVVLVVIMLLLFLGNLRSAFVVAALLPFTVLATFAIMAQTGISANLMSLGGLAIAIGMLVDGAVVVVENIVTRLGHDPDVTPLLHRIQRACLEVAKPMVSGILIIMVVFLPLLSLQGLEGKMFSPVAITICYALGSSIILALTFIPVLASFMLRKGAHGEPWLVRFLLQSYERLLSWALHHPKIIYGIAAIGMILALCLFPFLGKSFMPTMDEGNMIVQLEKLPSIGLEESLAMDLKIQRQLLQEVPEIAGMVARTGSDELGLDSMGLNQTDTFLVLKPKEQWQGKSKDDVVEAIRKTLSAIPGLVFNFTQPIEMRVSEMLLGVRGDIAIKIFGNDLETLNAKADEIASMVKTIKGAKDVYTVRNEGVQFYNLDFDRLALGRAGLTTNAIQDLLRQSIEGIEVGTIFEGIKRTPLLLRALGEQGVGPEVLTSLPIAAPEGGIMPLSNFVRFNRSEGPVQISHEKAQRYAVVMANVQGRDLVGFVQEAQSKVKEAIDLVPGYSLSWSGQFENQQRAAKRLSIVVPLAIGLVYLFLFSTFGSLKQAALVLGNIPPAMIGGVFALWIAGEYLSVPASVGFIALLGIAVLNGVVLVNYFNQLYARGFSMDEVVRQGALRRMRPVLMTASITATGLIPMLFATGPGSEIQKPLAVVVIGGVVSATFFTLLVLPLLYRRFGQSKES